MKHSLKIYFKPTFLSLQRLMDDRRKEVIKKGGKINDTQSTTILGKSRSC